MVFSSMTFLCVFLPVVFLIYCILPSVKIKNIFLVFASVLFYAYGEPVYVLLLLASTWLNYVFGRMLDKNQEKFRKIVLIVAVICNLVFLGIFKYTDMLISTGNWIFHSSIPTLGISLPIGISFYTFQAMSYVIDVYRRDVESQKKYLNVVLYISFFPQLIAGPIVKYHDIQRQIDARKIEYTEVARGLHRFIIGLGKKVLISNTMALAADAVFNASAGELNIGSAWIGAVAYMLQIYYDFSAYSDMAIGLGHMFGFHFQENFKYPYISASVTEFWRRWHISLSSWFKEYLYIPLGGNRKGMFRTCMNKIIVFFCTGLWHGANWTFVIWGLFHGLFLLLELVLPLKKLPKVLRHVYTLLVVCIGFVIFRADTMTQALQMISQMFCGWDFSSSKMIFAVEQLTPMFIFTFIVAIIGSTPLLEKIQKRWNRESLIGIILQPASYVFTVILLFLCMLSLASGTYNPFIYFRF